MGLSSPGTCLLAARLLTVGGVLWCGVVFLGVERIKKVSHCDEHCADTEIAGYRYDLRNYFLFGYLLC